MLEVCNGDLIFECLNELVFFRLPLLELVPFGYDMLVTFGDAVFEL